MAPKEEQQQILEVLKSVISQTAGNDPSEIYLDADIEHDLGLSPLDLVRITTKLNHKLDIEIDVDDIMEVETIEEWLQIIIDEVRLG